MATVNIYKCEWCGKTLKKRPQEVEINQWKEQVCLYCFMRREWPTYREETRRKNGLWY